MSKLRTTYAKVAKVTRAEIVGMWLFSDRYSRSSLGAKEFFDSMSDGDKKTVVRFINEYERAVPDPLGRVARIPVPVTENVAALCPAPGGETETKR